MPAQKLERPAFDLSLAEQSGHASAATAKGVEQSDRSPITMTGGDLLFLSHGHLGAVVRRRALRGLRNCSFVLARASIAENVRIAVSVTARSRSAVRLSRFARSPGAGMPTDLGPAARRVCVGRPVDDGPTVDFSLFRNGPYFGNTPDIRRPAHRFHGELARRGTSGPEPAGASPRPGGRTFKSCLP